MRPVALREALFWLETRFPPWAVCNVSAIAGPSGVGQCSPAEIVTYDVRDPRLVRPGYLFFVRRRPILTSPGRALKVGERVRGRVAGA